MFVLIKHQTCIFWVKSANLHALRPKAQTYMYPDQRRNPKCLQTTGANSHDLKPQAQACVVSDRGHELPDQRQKIACSQATGANLKCFRPGHQRPEQGRKLACFHAKDTNLDEFGLGHKLAFKPNAQVGFVAYRGCRLPDQGLKLACL